MKRFNETGEETEDGKFVLHDDARQYEVDCLHMAKIMRELFAEQKKMMCVCPVCAKLREIFR